MRAVAIVDAADHAALAVHNWSLGSDGYARRFEAAGVRKRRGVAMHRQVLGLGIGDPRECDHINGDRLDNRRANLRVVSRAENCQNVAGGKGKSGHRHVYWHAPSGLWHVQLHCGGRCISGGYFKEVRDAALAAKELRRAHMPFAVEGRTA